MASLLRGQEGEDGMALLSDQVQAIRTSGGDVEIFPPVDSLDFENLFSPDAPVFVLMSGKPFARATVTATASSSSFPGRFRVQYDDGSIYHVRPQRLIRLYGQPLVIKGIPGEPTLVVTASTQCYRQLARTQTLPTDIALEIGSDLGLCTNILNEGCSKVTGFDKSPDSVAEARRRFPHIPFVCADILATNGACLLSTPAFEEDISQREKSSAQCPLEAPISPPPCLPPANALDLIFIDINGNRMLREVLRCIAIVRRVLANIRSPRLIVVKSSEMATALRETQIRVPHCSTATEVGNDR